MKRYRPTNVGYGHTRTERVNPIIFVNSGAKMGVRTFANFDKQRQCTLLYIWQSA